ncbi:MULTISPECIES: helix-turn-helix domain-containing protein [unclassified Oceanispirochaeta]|uniref:helix-turn-helix domain-containing protein n=1 Tax=unclassified Oceanispirochaeta TaxID=2635722 RepID=UPI000E097074|nr:MULTISPECIES: helix-turn-helix domain-containing protein [unclassified Oceanispirochaeta]MBF9017719.1 helix-turn-helix domain-containing protein [Oceanispirochaeta sp. M2]NPD72122.1 helix-turn-helix domain-containing protein [Oceanispirochaeta sp. M1]RDG32564.1 ArsR family transcriptional regulator [Oceanispirochaeta sp. M1]
MNTKKRADLVLHPVRLRIISLLSALELTAGQIAAKLPDVPQATLYRHLKSLENASLINVVDSHPVRGTVEKIYGLRDSAAVNFDQDDAGKFSREDHQKYFSAFLGSLFNSFMNIVNSLDEHPELLGRLGYRTRAVEIPAGQLADFQKDYLALLEKYGSSEEGIKERYLLSTVIVPEVNYES